MGIPGYIGAIWGGGFVLMCISLGINDSLWLEDESCCCFSKRWHELKSEAMDEDFEEQDWFVSYLKHNLILITYL